MISTYKYVMHESACALVVYCVCVRVCVCICARHRFQYMYVCICMYLSYSIYTHHRINVGWSTLGNKLSKAESQLEPTNETSFSHDEKSYMEAVVQRAEAEDDQEALRIKYVTV